MSKKRKVVPKHIAVIPDGNRRWARKHKLSLLQGYNLGIKKFVEFGEWLVKFEVKTLTVWALSTENIMNRSKKELSILYKLYIKASNDPEIINSLARNRTKVNIIGNLSMIPKEVKNALRSLEKRTKKYKDYTINLLVAYGGREDLEYAIKKIASEKVKRKSKFKINEEIIHKYLRTALVPKVDMVIRTSGEKRVSGFLPWQIGYSELYFARKYWPDFNKRDLKRAIEAFSKRQRRFGR